MKEFIQLWIRPGPSHHIHKYHQVRAWGHRRQRIATSLHFCWILWCHLSATVCMTYPESSQHPNKSTTTTTACLCFISVPKSILAKFQDHDPQVRTDNLQSKGSGGEAGRIIIVDATVAALGTETGLRVPENSTPHTGSSGEGSLSNANSTTTRISFGWINVLKVNSESRSGHYNNKIILPTMR